MSLLRYHEPPVVVEIGILCQTELFDDSDLPFYDRSGSGFIISGLMSSDAHSVQRR